jgi:hypothetical protein
MAQVLECLPSKRKTLNLNPSKAKIEKKRNGYKVHLL